MRRCHLNRKYRKSPFVEDKRQRVRAFLAHRNASVPAALRTGPSGQTLLHNSSRKQLSERTTIPTERRHPAVKPAMFLVLFGQTHWQQSYGTSSLSGRSVHISWGDASEGRSHRSGYFLTGLKRADTKPGGLRVSFNYLLALKQHYKHIQIMGQRRSHLPFPYKINCNVLQK